MNRSVNMGETTRPQGCPERPSASLSITVDKIDTMDAILRWPCVLLATACVWGACAQKACAQTLPAPTVQASAEDVIRLPPIGTDEQNLLPAPTSAESSAMTLEELETLAAGHNPTLLQALARVDALRGKWLQDGLYPNPRVFYRGDEIGDQKTAGFEGGGFSQEIVTNGKLGLARNVASQQINQAIQEYTVQELRVQNDVKLRYNDVLIAQRALEIYQQLEHITRLAANVANDLFKANQVARSDVLQARVEADTLVLQSVKARNAYESAWRRLAVVVGMPELPPAPLAGEVERATTVTWELAWVQIAANSPELSAARAKVDAARWAVRKATADRFPNLEVQAGYAFDNQTSYDTANVTMAVPVPLFDRNQGAIRQAQANLAAADAEVERMTLELRNRLALVFERYANAQQQVDRYERSILPDSKQSMDLIGSLYRSGESNYTAYLLSQRTFLQTQIAYIDSLRELRETSVLLNGLLLSDSLAGGAR